ncbi:hypothetical protein BOTBODRAFT_29813 [Botryobasidium botryosum FD-172 SS1]|uniref:DUF6593 domain-containing protein n=1 Tax=Botryobasidium botryosum (strain FD-172 SS1) TaxID=930990 RepID=A0A067MPG9_BOTB1|nr:hypothetical protein BOTBODRAFT_29813 [Botryobasidium botryosum FD-172 SS1]
MDRSTAAEPKRGPKNRLLGLLGHGIFSTTSSANEPPMPSQVANSLAFYFSKNSARNTVITGASVIYHVNTPTELLYKGDRITTITRVGRDGRSTIVGEFIWNVYSSTMVRFGGDDEWIPMREFLKPPQDGGAWNPARSFSGSTGIKYKWNEQGQKKVLTLTLDKDPTALLAVLHPPKYNLIRQEVRKAYLEISPAVENSLDVIIVSLLLIERKRREAEDNHGVPV